jgi:hypothetical protein
MSFDDNLDPSSADFRSAESPDHCDPDDTAPSCPAAESPGGQANADPFRGQSATASRIRSHPRLEKGRGPESATVKAELAKPDNWDLQNYSRNACPYSRALMRLVGALSTPTLIRLVKEVESSSNEKCKRVLKRSEPLMVKWLWQRREHILAPQPVVACVAQSPAAVPETPVVIARPTMAPIEGDEAVVIDVDLMEDFEEFENA